MGISKYTLESKKICRDNYKGLRSAKSVAHNLGLNTAMVRRWVKFHGLYGLAGL